METFENYGRQITLDELISSQEASPVNPTPSPESERERRTSATCGPRCCALFENAPRATSWAKTFAALLVGMEGWSSRRCALTWKLKGTPFNRSYFQLQASAHPTEEIEFGLLLTPTTTERSEHPDEMRARAEAKGYRNGTKYNSLTSQILYGNFLPTPTAYDYNPTPKCQEERGNASRDRGKFNLTDEVARIWKPPGKTSQLSPRFVEEMMGFPKNWTASPFQSGEENP
jgi:hypothetical protein